MVRNIRTFSLLVEMDKLKMILETSKHITKPILGKFLFIYLIFYVYAELGSYWFGGEVTIENFQKKCKTTLPLYYLLNFNDYSAAIITLFQQMVVNNWSVTVGMYTSLMPDW